MLIVSTGKVNVASCTNLGMRQVSECIWASVWIMCHFKHSNDILFFVFNLTVVSSPLKPKHKRNC